MTRLAITFDIKVTISKLPKSVQKHRTSNCRTQTRWKEHLLTLTPVKGTQKFNHQSNTHPFNGPLSGTNRVSGYQRGKTNLHFTEARDGEWQWHQLGHMQVCTSLQTDNHVSTPPLSFLQAECPTNSVKALKVHIFIIAPFPPEDLG